MLLFNKNFDERFVLHRLKSTRFATMVAAAYMGAYYFYEYAAHRILRMDILVIMAILAAAKLAAMLYYRLKN